MNFDKRKKEKKGRQNHMVKVDFVVG